MAASVVDQALIERGMKPLGSTRSCHSCQTRCKGYIGPWAARCEPLHDEDAHRPAGGRGREDQMCIVTCSCSLVVRKIWRVALVFRHPFDHKTAVKAW